ncbi:hypothetical protein [Halobacteriovorax sp. HLS]|uniref:coiled-coil domain-containing protein n=1 Tax=Halobacteriovorax sp. HLS TaxID=2234000 RepID=UPI000FDA83EB|nr:hypothetical protein [Halobacteriovorax sp. HLS]
MKYLALLILVQINLISANVILEEDPSYIKGKSCLQKMYEKDDFADFDKINSKVSCLKKVEVDKAGKISNLNCPSDPFFEDYFTNGSSHKYQNTCLRSDRNSKLKRFENVNCDCVEESLKNIHKEDYPKKIATYKKKLNDLALSNIGKRLTNKISILKKTDRALSSNNPENYCFNGKNKYIINKMVSNGKCPGLNERLNKAFAKQLGFTLDENTPPTEAINLLLDSINAPEEHLKNVSKNSCFKSDSEFNQYYNAWSTHPGYVNMNETFDGFTKNLDLDSPTLNDDFYKYLRKNKIELHPTLRTLAHENLRKLLGAVKDQTSKGQTNLEDFLKGNNNEWTDKAIHSVNKMCAYVMADMKKLLCPSADFALDDPEFIEMIHESSDEETNSKNQDSLIENDLELKAIYCENKDINQVDENAKALAIKAMYKNLQKGNYKTKYITSEKFEQVINDFKNSNKFNPDEVIEDLFNLSFADQKLPKEIETHRKLGILNALTDNIIVDQKLLTNIKKDIENPQRQKDKSLALLITAMKMKGKLHKEKLNTVERMGSDLFPHMNTSLSKAEFQSKFLKSYRDKNYTRNFTEYSKHFKTDPYMKEEECANNFKNIYCSSETKMMSNISDEKKLSCFKNKLPDVMKDFLGTIYPDIRRPSSICDYSQKMSSSSHSKTDEVSKHIENFFKDPSIYKEDGFCNTKTFAQRTTLASSKYTIGSSDSIHGLSFSSSDAVMSTHREAIKESIEQIADNISDKERTPAATSGITNDIINSMSEGISKVSDSMMTPENKNYFSNISKQIADIEEQNPDKSSEKYQNELKNKEREMMEYIKQLEERISKKENSKDSTESTNISANSELEALKNELAQVRLKSQQLKNKITASKESKVSPIVAKKSSAPVIRRGPASFDNTRSSFATSSSVPAEKETVAPINKEQAVAPVINQEMNRSKDNSISLTSTTSDASSNIKFSENADNTVNVKYNNQEFKLEVSFAKNGEIICSFADEELNKTKAEELDSICKEYKDNLKTRDIASKEDTKKDPKKKELPQPPKKKRSQQFKVEDLNKVLSN